MKLFVVCAVLLCTSSSLAFAQNIQIQALPQTITYRENDFIIVCSITNPSKLSSVFVIQLLKNSSTTFEPVVSVTTGQTPLVEWKDSTLQYRAFAKGNVDSPSSAQLRLTIDKARVQCPTDFKMYMCKMSGYASSGLVTQETGSIVLSYIVKPTVIEMPRVRILNENFDTQDRQFPVGTAMQLTCQGEVGSDASQTIRWCAQRAGEFIFTGLPQTPIFSEVSQSGCMFIRSSTITYNLTSEDTFTKFLCEAGDTGLCGTGTAIQYVNITIVQSSILVPFLSGSTVGIVVVFTIILAIIWRRYLRQQQMNERVYQNHNGKGRISNKSEDHYTEPGPTEDHLYTELNSISTVIGQFAYNPDNQYTELHTINRQLEIDQASLTPDHQYTSLNAIQNTQTTNIPRLIQYK
uniref:Ig-like domain-containing protein n=1 Tax=Magallana gigas TaxID=29159 RepID=A0A8W8KLM2_MAGGI